MRKNIRSLSHRINNYDAQNQAVTPFNTTDKRARITQSLFDALYLVKLERRDGNSGR